MVEDTLLLFALCVATIFLLAIGYSIWNRKNPYRFPWKYFELLAVLFWGAVVLGILLNGRF